MITWEDILRGLLPFGGLAIAFITAYIVATFDIRRFYRRPAS